MSCRLAILSAIAVTLLSACNGIERKPQPMDTGIGATKYIFAVMALPEGPPMKNAQLPD